MQGQPDPVVHGISGQRQAIRQSGFTLLEVLVAMVILGLAYVAVLQNFSSSLENVLRLEKNRRTSLAASIELDHLLRPAAEEGAGKVAGSLYLEGSRYRMMLMSSGNDEFVTLRLEKKY